MLPLYCVYLFSGKSPDIPCEFARPLHRRPGIAVFFLLSGTLLLNACTEKQSPSRDGERKDSPSGDINASEVATSPLAQRAFSELLKNRDLVLSQSPQCLDESNPQRTVGDLLSAYLSYPAENENLKFNIYTQCEETKAEQGTIIVDAYDCKLAITQEDTLGISATLMFSIEKSNFSLMTDSLRCF